MKNIKSSLSKARGVKEEGAVKRRIGRLQQKYPLISKLCLPIGSCDSPGLKMQGINHSRSRIRNTMSPQTTVTTRMKLENRDCLILRNATRPNQEQAKIYRALNFKQMNPKMEKKAVAPLNEI